ncbi:MAG TPA: thrombospondin type 3 repeat-containing protein [Bacteroidia bacterium]|nr:thrombospondin type 3 repeat-containing protein [Bacteroidia bacterium]
MKRSRFLSVLIFFLMLTLSSFAGGNDSLSKGNNLPTIGIGDGTLFFSGDVGTFNLAEPLHFRNGIYFEVQKKSRSRIDFSLFILSGKLYGNISSPGRNLNFLSAVTTEGLNLRYNFSSNSEKILIPYISLGIEVVSYTAKSDLLDANGNKYYFWNDGTIRSMDQSSPNAASDAVKLTRDYVYETDLRSANIDNRSSYPSSALSFPIGAGLKFRLSDRFHLRVSAMYHLTNSDLIDGIDENGVGERQGDSGNDKFIFTSASLHFDLSAKKNSQVKSRTAGEKLSWTGTSDLEMQDTDKDGVNDLLDECPGTIAAMKVNDRGCPLDTDRDGIPDYRDKEPNSSSGAMVNEDGITLTDKYIEEIYARDSLNELLQRQIEMLKSKDASRGESFNGQTENSSDTTQLVVTRSAGFDNSARIPEGFRFVDADRNGFISPAEMTAAIDDYLKDHSPLDTKGFHLLIDYFFDQ